jgi:hypothetical protein
MRKKIIAALAGMLALFVLVGTASAHEWRGYGHGYGRVYAPAPRVFIPPAPVYVQPPIVYGQPYAHYYRPWYHHHYYRRGW